ncbi:N-acetylmannosamine-6-phosphate 2-epimerase [Biomaibacter acetigenes]|uniref:Putative N-acetylmannosamine-6-phosphate 2-epimerase n=1 Tax=Biomaibacter acetigenes TaxID=2316383 RepID=A0A3G2R8I1_9FIRM|nr:N-acetylmannosamine-6-phosphate 2-epimerase [Biomaibacter acetigenes]AYO31792.1 N-acetylmannosamine-6-phosphate 2-epimerase [Biomaibacter acetigenes]
MMLELLSKLKNGLIVSCQAFEHEPLYGADIMAKMAICAEIGGAVAVRASWPENIREIKKVTNLPIFGINKIITKDTNKYEDVIITPTFEAAKEIYEAGADIIAVDCTDRKRPNGVTSEELIKRIKQELGVPVMAEVSTLEEGIKVAQYGPDIISTTLAGYTNYSVKTEGPDLELVEKLAAAVDIPINAEGRFWTPEQMIQAFEKGAWVVTIGSAITRPQLITKRFTSELEKWKKRFD